MFRPTPRRFSVIAADDRFFKTQDLSLIHNWRRSGGSVEFHLYSAGGHALPRSPMARPAMRGSTNMRCG
jgi:hypothetical protein